MSTSMWHPFADMNAVDRDGELVLVRGQGARVWDEQGREYLDATAGLWFANVGHGRQEIADAVGAQAATLAAHHTFGDLANRPALDLAERVASIAPVAGSKVFFTSGGSDSVDSAVKLARRYWSQVGQPQRTVVVVRDKAYHGMHMAGTSLAGIDDNRQGYGDLDPDVVRVPWDDAAALAKAVDDIGAARVAAFFCEPVIGAGGVFAAGPQYLADVRQVCAERDVLYVSDEVVTGFARTGAWFASTRYGLEPDLLLCAKGITSGYVPMGAVVAAPRVAEPFWSAPPGGSGPMWRHGYTYSGHAVAAAAGLTALDITERERLSERALELESLLAQTLRPLADLPAVAQVRAGTGVLAAVQTADASLISPAVAGLRQRGVLTRGLWGGALQISPPLVVTDAEVGELGTALREVLSGLA
jgi:putrescine---pyruvate transaminase